jgi:hypothetical protein
MAIPMYERQGRLAALPDGRVQAPGGPDAYGAGAGKALGTFAAALRAKVDDFEDAQVMEALNAFERDMSSYRLDPDKGIYAARRGKAAPGVADDADAASDNLMFKYEKTLGSPRAAAVFRQQAARIRGRYYGADQKWEFEQVEAYKTNEANAGIKLSLDGAAADWNDPAAVETRLESGRMAVELLTRGMGDERRKLAFAEYESSAAMIQLTARIEDDPLAAEAWYNERKDLFTGIDAAKAEKTLAEKTKQYKLEASRDDLIKRYGMNYAGARKEILEKYQGDEEIQILQGYEAWYGDQKRIRDEAWQKNSSELANAYLRGESVTREQIQKMVDDRRISPEMGMRWAETFENRIERLEEKERIKTERLQAELDEFNKNRMNEALDDLARELNFARNDPDSGVYNTRKMGSAKGVADEQDANMEKLIDRYAAERFPGDSITAAAFRG